MLFSEYVKARLLQKKMLAKITTYGVLDEVRSCFKFDKDKTPFPAPFVQFLDENEKELYSLLFGDLFGNFNNYQTERMKAVWV